ncbi:hypothetical protein K493DRAFT_318631 [Basidiobolus meristosporus CBS 931.73]|uniref:gamma-glutamylcyclotransferase n=1 Tax=Basidiobolus meristosporus CBS 931.73 TaxID=1314790 RepID=A0A1Y1XV04_9FUNG|nr:hypothetical protein K493DRAFT_318631 [Basidiobolus meristosporus CBS 931.73]|eukprot:ORX89515.1 hypothetical protein K493DRAFT_318631 [Basidiobolus meristosporus CBS 931.73]
MLTPKLWYFAFGSNMSAAQMTQRGVQWIEGYRVLGNLKGYRLLFNKLRTKGPMTEVEGFANLEKSEPEREVYGVLYGLPSDAGLLILDRYEGVELQQYERVLVDISVVNYADLKLPATVTAVTYIARNPQVIRSNLKPSKEYLGRLLAGRDLLPSDYYNSLAKTETLTTDQPGA